MYYNILQKDTERREQMPTKYNNILTLRLTDEQTDYLINLMNDNFCIDSMASAVRYCINSEIHRSKMQQMNSFEKEKSEN